MITRTALLFCLVFACIGVLVAAMAVGGTSSTGVLADATVPAPTVPAQSYLPLVHNPPAIGVYDLRWQRHGVDEAHLPKYRVLAELHNNSGRRVEIDSVTVELVDVTGEVLASCREMEGCWRIWILDAGMSTLFDCFVTARDVPVEARVKEVAWHATDEEIIELLVTDMRCVFCSDPWMTWYVLSGRVTNPTDRLALYPVMLLYDRDDNGYLTGYWWNLFRLAPGETKVWGGNCGAGGSCCPSALPAAKALARVSDCVPSHSTLASTPIGRQSDVFAVEFDIVATGSGMSFVVGLSLGPATAFSDLGPIVRCNPSTGRLEARNGDVYQGDNPYTSCGGHITMVIDVPNHLYSAYEGRSDKRPFATDYAFRTEQGTVSALDHWVTWCGAGSVQICSLRVLPVDTE